MSIQLANQFPKILVKDIKEFPLPDINSSLSQNIKNDVIKTIVQWENAISCP